MDESFHSDLLKIMDDGSDEIKKAYPEGSFAKLFWEEQLKAAKVSDSSQVQWYPIIIKWCINLKPMSSSSYHALRTSGFIKLPSERTLRDYTHYFINKPGFLDKVMIVNFLIPFVWNDWMSTVRATHKSCQFTAEKRELLWLYMLLHLSFTST